MGALFSRLAVTMLAALPVFAAARILYKRRTGRPTRWPREIVLGLFAAFFAGLVALVLQPGSLYQEGMGYWQSVWARLASGRDINLVPLATIRQFFVGGWNVRFVVNIIANVLMFSPIGFCLPLLWQRWQSGARVLAFGLCFSAAIEVAQLFAGRSTDVDDVLLNAAGVMLGYGVYAVVGRVFPRFSTVAMQIIEEKPGESPKPPISWPSHNLPDK